MKTRRIFLLVRRFQMVTDIISRALTIGAFLSFVICEAWGEGGPPFSDANWVSLSGLPGTELLPTGDAVVAAVADNAGNLYIGGNFTIVGNVIASHIAKWNGTNWSALGSGLDGKVYALALSGNNLYAGGAFTNAGGTVAAGIARWDGTNWSALGSGVGNGFIGRPEVYALAVSGNNLYAGGPFTFAGGNPANFIARWDGSSWSAFGSGVNSTVRALAVSGSDVYAAGDFTVAGVDGATNIAKWDGAAWSALGSGMGGGTQVTPTSVYALAVSGNSLFAGGNFTTAGGNAATNIAMWDGNGWTAVGPGLADGPSVFPQVAALAVSDGNLYAGGYFETIGGALMNHIAKWNGTTWTALSSGLDAGNPGTFANISALAVSSTNLYAGGNFTRAGDRPANNIAMWDGNNWTPLGTGLGRAISSYPAVTALTVSGSDLYAGGNFTAADRTAVNYIARWNGSNWSALGTGLNNNVHALAVAGTDLYAGGVFTIAGGSTANRIAKWNGNAWSPLGTGMDNHVEALAVSGSDLYAGGIFNTAGGRTVNHIAKWNGSTWTNLAGGLNSIVSALAVSGGNLYAGGSFSTASNTNGIPFTVNCIAKWNGTNWSALGSGMSGSGMYVFALAISSNYVYAGGRFTMAGGIPANHIARWDGTNWSALGPGLGFDPFNATIPVYALLLRGNILYAGGSFTNAGNVAVNYIARWDGTNWSALGSGISTGAYANYISPFVYALSLSPRGLFAGGTFTMAGGKVSGYVAEAIIDQPPFFILTGNGSLGYRNGQFSFTLTGPDGSNAVILASANLQTWTSLLTNTLTGGSLNFTDTLASNFTSRFYRALLQP